MDRLENIYQTLTVTDGEEHKNDGCGNIGKRSNIKELKQKILYMFDNIFSADSPKRRYLSVCVYCQLVKGYFEKNFGHPRVLSSHADCCSLKTFISLNPATPN